VAEREQKASLGQFSKNGPNEEKIMNISFKWAKIKISE
jgi:hypothetical protein